MTEPETLRIEAGHASTGAPVYEEVLVEAVGDDCFRLLASPGIALGMASGDLIRLEGEQAVVVERGGNLSIHVYAREPVPSDPIRSILDADGLEEAVYDGGVPDRLWVFTIPVTTGFETVEAAFDGLVAREAMLSWSYGNVYDEDDQPLGWWDEGGS